MRTRTPPRRRTLVQWGLAGGWGAVAGQVAAQSTAPLPMPMPPELGPHLAGAALAGSTRMRFFGLNIYDARLWTPPGFRPAAYWSSAFALELIYLRSLSGSAIAQRSLDEMQRSGTLDAPTAERWLAAMVAAFPDVKDGDRLTGLHTPGQGARFWLNGLPRPEIKDAEFSRRFFGIWLAESTSEPRLRAALLAGVAP